MSVFFKKQDKVIFRNQEEVTEYWLKEGAHQLSDEEVDAMLDLMVDDVTFRITTNFFRGQLGVVGTDDHVLDAGCGWGRSLLGLKRHLPNAKITGVDITAALLELGRSICAKEHIEGVTWQEGSLLELPFDDDAFSHVISTRVLHYIVEPEKAAAELVRVLRPGGRCVAIVPNRWNPLLAISYHTKVYSPRDLRGWFARTGVTVRESGSIGFVPPFRFLRKCTWLEGVDRVIRRIPLLRNTGGLAYVVVEKNV